ncbi:MAG: D-aminoacyl-tRNA deacylase [Bacillota bacterium]
MRAVIQRCRSGRVTIDGQEAGRVGRGLVVLLGVGEADDEKAVAYIADKTANLRVFEDDQGKMNRSVLDVGGEVLAISQFTLYGDVRNGRRPGFSAAARPEKAEPLYQAYVAALRAAGLTVATGRFAADMLVQIENDGPVTILVDSDRLF